ncbi:MAG TPA: HlyD family efflux transporter periplasmic adaptor subunit, partial [Gemmatimonadaceae bacterium]|nr:HlyD family efflux transporter periplasmic adaptor subunit [Gemmatimonadaceae bacterium]
MDIRRAAPSKKKQYLLWGTGVGVIALMSVGIGRLKPAAASVERSTLWFDAVKRGEMKREVHASGTLLPEHIRIIAAVTAGRIEQLPVRPGDKVTPNSVIVDLSNPDVQLQALQAEQAVTQSRSALAGLRTLLVQQRLAQEGAIAALVTQSQKAQRDAGVQEELDSKGLTVRNDLETARDAASELRARLVLEQQRLDELKRSATEQIALDEEQIERLKAIVRANLTRVSSMRVLAGETGVLQTLGNPPLEVGQWVSSGFELARVAQPGTLKAVLRVAEAEAKDVAIGQRASIDTRNGVVPGHVTRADPSSQSGTVTVEVALDGPLPPGTRSDLSVDGTIEIERLADVLYVARPAAGSEDRTVGVFKVEPNSGYADRVNVKLGRASVNTIQILQGLAAGDS